MRYLWALAPALLSACVPQPPQVERPEILGDFRAALRSSAPNEGTSACWHSEVQPALYETVTLQELASPEQRDAEGRILRPASFRSVTKQSELRPRRAVWFEIPCPEARGREDVFIASLQRALKARGGYEGAVTGVMDAPTRAALHRYQAQRGLHSAELSQVAAQSLGLVAVLERQADATLP